MFPFHDPPGLERSPPGRAIGVVTRQFDRSNAFDENFVSVNSIESIDAREMHNRKLIIERASGGARSSANTRDSTSDSRTCARTLERTCVRPRSVK